MDEKLIKQIECLLADYNAIKAEIGRRSNLQRIVLASYITVLALVFQRASSNSLTTMYLAGLWIAGVMALLYYVREDLEIKRLGKLIKGIIAPLSAKITGAKPEDLFPSQTIMRMDDFNYNTRIYYTLFLWLSFFVIPLLLTLSKVFQLLDKLKELINPWEYLLCHSIVTLIAIAGVIYLLFQVAWPLQKPEDVKSITVDSSEAISKS